MHRPSEPSPTTCEPPRPSVFARIAVASVVSSATATATATAAAAGAQRVGGGLPGSGAEPASGSGSMSGFAIVLGILILIALVTIVAVIVAVTRTRSRRAPGGRPLPAPATVMAPPAPVVAPDTRSADERARLVQVLVEVGDQLDSQALAAWVGQALAEVGVTEVVVDGERFDPARHHALEHVVTENPAYDGLVARTARRGYVDRGRVIRLPQVLVYRYAVAAP